jgi:adenylate cyclase
MKSEPPETENERKMQALDSLARILKNGLATASDRQRRLIEYLATEELAGRGDRLKAVSIATDVLGRSVDFDPQTDSIVRVEMGRMRKALDLYYATYGVNDPVRIKFEKGSYRPKFEWIADAATARPSTRTPKRLWLLIALVLITALAGGVLFFFLPFGKTLMDRQAKPISIGGPKVAVAPIAFSSDTPGLDYLATGMQGELVGILAEFDWLTVFPIPTDQPSDKAFPDKMGRIDYIVRNTVRTANGKVAVSALLTDGKTGAVLWSNHYESPLEAAGLFDLQRNIAARIASDIGRPRGIIASLENTRIANDSFRTPEGSDCQLHAFRFYGTFDRADYKDAFTCAESASKTNDANALALFAALELAGQNFGYDGPSSPGRRARAIKLADQAFRLDDLGSLPRMASYTAAICGGDEERFRRISGLSLRDYPNNPAVLFDVAQHIILGMSEWSEGIALLERAHKLNPISDPTYGVLIAFDALQRGQDDKTILTALNLSSGTLSPSLQIIEMALRAHVGDQTGADRMRRSLQALGFTQRSDYLDLIDRACWTKQVKNTIKQLLAAE